MSSKQTIIITVNGKPLRYNDKDLNVNTLLESEGFADKKVAVAINGQFVARSSYNEHQLKDGDAIDIVAPMQGG